MLAESPVTVPIMKEVLSVVFLSAAHLSFYRTPVICDQNHDDSMSKFNYKKIIHSAGKMLMFD